MIHKAPVPSAGPVGQFGTWVLSDYLNGRPFTSPAGVPHVIRIVKMGGLMDGHTMSSPLPMHCHHELDHLWGRLPKAGMRVGP